MDPGQRARIAVEHAARAAFGRLLSWLAWQWRDIAAAEDALSDALLKALEKWPLEGVPAAPEAWLLAVAKRQLLQVARHDKVRFDPAVAVLLADDDAMSEGPAIPDARLKLLFICAHPAIDERVRIPLMLQTVLGLQVADIAPAMLVSPATLAQRLVRAKQKIRDAGLRFDEPDPGELPQRLHHVLEAIYGAFGMSVDAIDGAESRITDLQAEAMFLCSVVCDLLPDAAEAKGMWALMAFIHARAPARAAATDVFIPLHEQDVGLWDRAAIVRADQVLMSAARLHSPGPFQLEAAVQSAHCHRLFLGSPPWSAIAELYRTINLHFPTEGARVAGAVAMAEAGSVQDGLDQLERMDTTLCASFQPWWVARAHLLALAQRNEDAAACYRTAIGLTFKQGIRNHLEGRLRALGATGTAHAPT